MAEEWTESPYYKNAMQRHKFIGKQFPDGSKPTYRILWEQKYARYLKGGYPLPSNARQELYNPGDYPYQADANAVPPLLSGSPQSVPETQGEGWGLDPFLASNSQEQVPPPDFLGTEPPQDPSVIPPGLKPPPSQTIVPGTGVGNGFSVLFNDRFKDIPNAPMAGSDYEALARLNVWAGSDARKNGKELTEKEKQEFLQRQEQPGVYGGQLAATTYRLEGRVMKGDQYMALWFNMDEKQKQKIREKMVKAGILTPEQSTSVAGLKDFGEEAWSLLIRRAAMLYSASGGRNKVTPEDVLDQYATQGTGSSALTTKTQVDKDMRLSDARSASQALTQMLQGRLGRAPTKAEKSAFLAALNQYERENPTVRTTTTNLLTGDSSSTTTGGSDPAAFTADYAQGQNKKEYGAVQGATTYYNALMEMLGSPF